MSRSPLQYLTHAAGARAEAILPLTWYTLIVSIVVCIVIAALLWVAVRRARSAPPAEGPSGLPPVEAGPSGVRWISVGIVISCVPLAATMVWTMLTLSAVAGPPANPALTLDVTARDWWWDVRYAAADPTRQFSTANEIHIPVGVPVLVRLHAADVIHSFWVPMLSGKTDVIPGQTNLSWLEASAPGRYLGQCSEFCGFQHAHMQFEVVAESQQDFEKWRAAQLEDAAAPQTAEQTRGAQLVVYRCGLCHRVRGTDAGAVFAPDLTHLMSRRTIAAGTLPNNPGTLAGWIENSQSVKPGNLMPDQYLSGRQLADTVAYLETLK